jgi:methyl-accepting chemotaxis protein
MKKFIRHIIEIWQDAQLKIKFAVTFGIISLLIIILAAAANLGILGIVNDNETMLNLGDLQHHIEHNRAAHLQWANEVNRMLTDDNVKELSAETDHTLCEFGK